MTLEVLAGYSALKHLYFHCSIVDEMTGFTHIFRHLCQSKKVSVVHMIACQFTVLLDCVSQLLDTMSF